MKFSVNKDEFLKVLAIADSIINPRTPLSILLNIYIELHNDGQMMLLSYNGDHGVKIETNVDVQEAGRISVLSKKLLEIVRNIPGDRIEIEHQEGQLEVIIMPEGKTSPTFRLHSVSADTYPVFKEFSWEYYIKLNQNTLRELITATEFSVSNDMSQIAFTGIFVKESADGLLSFVATDGKRLAVITKPMEEKNGEVVLDVIIPQRIMKTVSDALGYGYVLFSVKEGQAYFKIDNIYIFSTLVEGKFPNYRDVIPDQGVTTLIVDASELYLCLLRVAIMSDNESGRIRLDVDDNRLTVSSSTAQGEGQDTVEIEYSGEPASVAVSYKSLTDFLRVLQGKKVIISMNSPNSPVLLMPSGESDYEYITMPMKV